ncbi:MAG: hypothetical protein QM710_08340 [Flavobacterium sp.]
MRKSLLNLFEFFKSALAVNLALSLCAVLFGGLSLFAIVFLTFGFAVSIAVKEVTYKNHYLFYYNNGLSKAKLWFYCYLINVLFLLLLLAAYNFTRSYFG